jgi:hypothetical protein
MRSNPEIYVRESNANFVLSDAPAKPIRHDSLPLARLPIRNARTTAG